MEKWCADPKGLSWNTVTVVVLAWGKKIMDWNQISLPFQSLLSFATPWMKGGFFDTMGRGKRRATGMQLFLLSLGKKKINKICVTDCCCGQACLYHSSYHPRHPGPACRAAAAWIYGSQQSKEGSVASVVNNLLVSTIYPLLGLAERSCACEILHCPHAFVSSLTFPGEHSISWGGGPLGGLVRSQRVCGPWTWHFHWWTTGVKTASEKVCSTLTKFSLSHFLHFLDVW